MASIAPLLKAAGMPTTPRDSWKPTRTTRKEEDVDYMIYVYVAISAAFLVVLAVTLFYCCCRKKKKAHTHHSHARHHMEPKLALEGGTHFYHPPQKDAEMAEASEPVEKPGGSRTFEPTNVNARSQTFAISESANGRKNTDQDRNMGTTEGNITTSDLFYTLQEPKTQPDPEDDDLSLGSGIIETTIQ